MTVTSPFAAGQLEVTPQWESYLDADNDVKPWLQFPETPQGPQAEARLERITVMACQWVQNYLGRPIAPTTITRRFSGWSGYNGSYISLPYYPVLEVKKVVEWWGLSGPHEITEQTPATQGSSEVFQLDAIRGTLIRTFQGLVQRPWFPGSRNIEVEWVAGYQPVPEDINVATLEFIKHWWVNTQEASRTAPMPAEYSPEVASGMWAGVPNRIVELLASYRQIGLG